MQRFQATDGPIEGIKILKTKPLSDDRGFFQRIFCDNEFKEIGLDKRIVNVNHSFTKKTGCIRGLHFQYQPCSETKIIKCIKGAIWDVVVDVRRDSPTFLQHCSIELSEGNSTMLYIPDGFAHGFQALEDNSEIIYFVTNYYSKELEMSLNPFDKKIAIKWPLECVDISDKDANAKMIDDLFVGV